MENGHVGTSGSVKKRKNASKFEVDENGKSVEEENPKKVEEEEEDDEDVSEDDISTDSEVEEKSDDDDDNKDDDEDKDIDIDFDAVTPVEGDFHGIKALLLRLILNMRIDVSQMTDTLINQKDVGSVVKVNNDKDEEIYGVLSALKLDKLKEWCKDLRKSITQKCPQNKLQKLNKIMDDGNVAFVVNERFINIPPHVAVPLHDSLRGEVRKLNAGYTHLMFMAKTVREADAVSSEQGSSFSPKAKKKKKEAQNSPLEFINFEDELFHQQAELSFNIDVTEAVGTAVSGEWEHGDKPMKSFRTVMLIKSDKWDAVLGLLAKSMEGELTYEEGLAI